MSADLNLREEDVEFVSAVDNPELFAAAERLSGADEGNPPPEIPEPLGGKVTLPAGFRRVKTTEHGTDFEVVRTAVVRELDGADEERIARANKDGDQAEWLRTILECGVEKLGDEAPTKDDLNALTFGDRDYLLMEIAEATYGDEIPYEGFQCEHCLENFDVTIQLTKDVPVKRLDSFEETEFTVELRGGKKAKVVLPTCEASPEMMKTSTAAETNTVILAHSVETIEGPNGTTRIQGDVEAAKRIKTLDRRKLLNEIIERMPGPQYDGVKFKHEPGCGEEVRLRVNVADLFLGL